MPVARSFSKMDSIIHLTILHHWGMGQNMPSKYATTSNVRYSENMSVVSDGLVLVAFICLH